MTVSLLADVEPPPAGGDSEDSEDERDRDRDRPRLETRTLRHLWHKEWPDHTKPVARESAAVILKMVRTACRRT